MRTRSEAMRARQLTAQAPSNFRNTARALGGTETLTCTDLSDFSSAARRVFALMRDGRWHDANAIIAISEQREGLRRMRELRRWFHIERRQHEGSRLWSYRLRSRGDA